MTQSQDPNDNQKSPSGMRQAWLGTGRAFGLLFGDQPGASSLWAGLSLIDALLPAGIALVAKWLVDAVVALDEGTALSWLAVECGLVVLRSVVYHANEFLRFRLGARLSILVNRLILEKTLALSPAHFEEVDFTDRLARATKEAGTRPLHLIEHGFGAGKEVVTLLSLSTLLWSFSPWLVGGILLGTGPQFFTQAWAAARVYAVQYARTLAERRADYLKEILTREAFVKEVKLFSLGRLVLGRFLKHQEDFFRADLAVQRKALGWVFLARLLATLSFYACYVVVVVEAARGAISLGDMTMLVMAVRGSQAAFEAVLNAVAKVYESNLYMANLFGFLAMEDDEPFEDLAAIPAGQAKAQDDGLTRGRIDFEKVDFSYPGTTRPVLSQVSFSVEAGQTLALVGPNGAGKTTLIKLLARIYQPTAGRISIDGVDIQSLSPTQLRSRIGIIFQDFVQFHLSAGDNIGLGWVPDLDKQEAIGEAARAGGAADFIEGLDQGYQTMLGRYYGGAQLSVGQWQRIAIARAFMRKADLLVLDEPTAALDAQNEAALFERFEALKHGRSAILITHRFSTVRFADSIVVLDGGRLVEQGSHRALMDQGGLYATMFETQAKGFRLA